MSTISLSLQDEAPASFGPLRTGIAASVTVASFYALSTLAWILAPGAFLDFINSLFHGLDLGSLMNPLAFAWSRFLAVLLVLSIGSFLAGALFGWVLRRLSV